MTSAKQRIREILIDLHWRPLADQYDKPHPIYSPKHNDEHIKEALDSIEQIVKEVLGKPDHNKAWHPILRKYRNELRSEQLHRWSGE